MTRAFAAAAVFPALVAGCGGGGPAGLKPQDGRRLTLARADLPAVFVQFDAGKQVTADALPGPRSDPGRFGRLGGWKARFRRPGSRATTGPLVVDSRVDLFRDRRGAERDFKAYEGQFHRVAAGGASRVEVPQLGDQAAGFTQRAGSGRFAVRFYTVVWRYRNATASLAANGFEHMLRLDQVVELARAQQRRMARAAG